MALPLPTNLTNLASTSEANRLYHQDIAAALPWLGRDDTITAGQGAHIADHEAEHAAARQGLPRGLVTGTTGHGGWHNKIHAYVNTTYQNEYHVTKGGNDANSGLWAAPLLTVQAGINKALTAAAAGQTARVRVHPTTPGTTTNYRESVSWTGGAPIIVEAATDGVVISGADDWTGLAWTTHDAGNRIYYRSFAGYGVQAVPTGWPTGLGWTDIYRRREVVIVDGVWIRQVLTLAELTSYSAAYFQDDATSRLYVRFPSGFTLATIPVEVGMRPRCLDAQGADGLQLRGFTFRYAVPTIDNPAVNVHACDGAVVEDCESRLNSWGGWGGASPGAVYRRVKCNDNGVAGYGAFQATDMVFEDLQNNRNNTYRGAWATFRDWSDGFKLFNARRVTFRRCDWYDNNAPGFWADTDNKDLLLEDCRITGNLGAGGVFTELTQGPLTLRRCKVYNNFRGVLLSNTRNVTIDDCDIWDNGIEIGVATNAGTGLTVTEWDSGAVVGTDPTNWTITNNLVWVSATDPDKFAVIPPSPYAVAEGWRSTLVASGNAYHSTATTTVFSRRNADGTTSTVNFTDWKAYLGSGRDSTSTFSSSAPSPAPSL